MGANDDQQWGLCLFVGYLAFFTYCTVWLLIMPTVDYDHPIQGLFPPVEYMLVFPAVFGTVVLTIVLTFVALVMIRSERKEGGRGLPPPSSLSEHPATSGVGLSLGAGAVVAADSGGTGHGTAHPRESPSRSGRDARTATDTLSRSRNRSGRRRRRKQDAADVVQLPLQGGEENPTAPLTGAAEHPELTPT